MVASNEGLTKTYNRFHNPEDTSPGIVKLRELHVQMDNAVRDAYGWQDFDLEHGWIETRTTEEKKDKKTGKVREKVKVEYRYTISERARQEVLRRLLQTMQQNLDGIARDIDTEFLHDFRVALRRTRSALGQMRHLFAVSEIQPFRDSLAEIQRHTNRLRDLDVYLLERRRFEQHVRHRRAQRHDEESREEDPIPQRRRCPSQQETGQQRYDTQQCALPKEMREREHQTRADFGVPCKRGIHEVASPLLSSRRRSSRSSL